MVFDPKIDPAVVTSLGRVIIAISWADGEIQQEEMECLRSLLQELPDLPQEEVHALECLLEAPIQPSEREVILGEFELVMKNHTSRNFALYWLNRILEAKGWHDDKEVELYERILKKTGLNSRHAQAAIHEDASIEEEVVDASTVEEPFARAQLLLEKIHSSSRAFIDADLLSDELLLSVLFIGMLAARVTRADYRIDEAEVILMRELIRRKSGLDKEHALKLAQHILIHHTEDDAVIHAISRLLFQRTKPEERLDMVKQLLKLSEGDGEVAQEELNAIIPMAAALELDQERFQQLLKNRI